MISRLLWGALFGVIGFIVALIIIGILIKIGLIVINVAFWAAIIGLLVFGIVALTGWTPLTRNQ